MIRKANAEDLPDVVALLQDDALGKTREKTSLIVMKDYQKAFDHIQATPGLDVFVLVKQQEIIGCYQSMVLPHLSYQGKPRLQIESMRIKSSYRGQGYGQTMMEHAVAHAKEHNCAMIQLTTDDTREDAKNFYRKLGFQPTHAGFKYHLS